MATEAQRLIGISLTKIAQSRAHRGGVSLHKNLLVATVLQKARYIFMEEAYHMVHAGSYCPPPSVHVPQPPQPTLHHPHHHQQQQQHTATTTTTTTPSTTTAPTAAYDQQNYDDDEDDDGGLVALTPEEAGIAADAGPRDAGLQDLLQPGCVRCTGAKDHLPPPVYQASASGELTYLDLDKSRTTTTCLKRRRAVTEWETEEAVLSILPKRSKPTTTTAAAAAAATDADDDGDDSVFLDEAALFSDCVAREAASAAAETTTATTAAAAAMDIDRITSLVSIFSFGNLAVAGPSATDSLGKLARSVSTPDLCSAQAKESAGDGLQQRPFLAMTV